MLRGLLKREIELDEPAAQRPQLAPVSAPNPSPGRSPKRRPRPVPIALLYPESEADSQVQAETLLHEIQSHAEDTIGKYVPQPHLKRFYEELCKERGWQVRHWSVIGAQLGRLTDNVIVKRGSKRFITYKIPRTHA